MLWIWMLLKCYEKVYDVSIQTSGIRVENKNAIYEAQKCTRWAGDFTGIGAIRNIKAHE